ncbi:MAG: hydroxyisourate hydrolase [Planktomarina sp.]
MTGYLTTHVLDTANGTPAQGIKISLYRLEGGSRALITQMQTNADGRTDSPILPKEDFATGGYELIFHTGDYLRANGHTGTLFLEDIPIRFAMGDADHYHVPLLLSPYGYSTYRGS